MWERNIDGLPPVCALTGDQTRNLLVYRMMPQPTEPPGQGIGLYFYTDIVGPTIRRQLPPKR